MFRRAAGQHIDPAEFDLELYTGNAAGAQSDGEQSSYLSSDFEHRVPWRMGNEGPGLESTDEYDDESESVMPRGKGRMFTLAELRKMAKFMATYSSEEWSSLNRTERWVPLLEQVRFGSTLLITHISIHRDCRFLLCIDARAHGHISYEQVR